jgi:hypothetical protein
LVIVASGWKLSDSDVAIDFFLNIPFLQMQLS